MGHHHTARIPIDRFLVVLQKQPESMFGLLSDGLDDVAVVVHFSLFTVYNTLQR